MIVSHNATAFMATSVQNFMRSKYVAWNEVITDALMAKGRAERIEETIKNAIKSSIVKSGGDSA